MEGTGLLVVIVVIILIISFFIIFNNLSDSEFQDKQEELSKYEEIPGSFGEFGLVITNPIPFKSIFSSYLYLSQLRYPFKSNTGFTIYLPVAYERGGSGGSNFAGPTDNWSLYDIKGSKLATIYTNGYQSYTSQKAPKGFFLSTEVDINLDDEKVLEKFKNLSEEEKLNLNKERFNELFS